MVNVLIPTDFSDNAWNAIAYGVQFFKDELVNFYLLHVSLFDRPEATRNAVSNSVVFDFGPTTSVEENLTNTLDRIDQLYPNTRHKFTPIQEQALFIDAIKRTVEKKKIDFILMGTKGASGLKEVTIGTQTGEVITRVKCPTMVIPEYAVYKKPEHLVFPTDFNSFYKDRILSTLSEIMWMNKSKVHIMHVTKKNHELSPVQAENKEFLDDFLMGKPHEFHFIANRDMEHALAAIIEDAQIDMIAMVAKNVNFFQRLFFKPSVAKISYHTRIPFLVLHE